MEFFFFFFSFLFFFFSLRRARAGSGDGVASSPAQPARALVGRAPEGVGDAEVGPPPAWIERRRLQTAASIFLEGLSERQRIARQLRALRRRQGNSRSRETVQSRRGARSAALRNERKKPEAQEKREHGAIRAPPRSFPGALGRPPTGSPPARSSLRSGVRRGEQLAHDGHISRMVVVAEPCDISWATTAWSSSRSELVRKQAPRHARAPARSGP
jgi:hypothetical protein